MAIRTPTVTFDRTQNRITEVAVNGRPARSENMTKTYGPTTTRALAWWGNWGTCGMRSSARRRLPAHGFRPGAQCAEQRAGDQGFAAHHRENGGTNLRPPRPGSAR